MPRALGKLVTLNADQTPTRFEHYLLLSDVLIEASTKTGKAELGDLANSFSNDILNIAALAGRLLWDEGVSAVLWGSHDVITVSVDTQSYFVIVQTACD